MTKRYDEAIEVDLGESIFSWRGRRYSIEEQLTTWLEAGEWWLAAERRDREYHRILARPVGVGSGDVDADGFLTRAPHAVFDVYLDRMKGSWRLARVWD